MSIPEIEELVKGLEDETKDIKKDLFKLCWYFRGGLTLDEAYQLDVESRAIMYDIIKDNLETTKKTGLPFF